MGSSETVSINPLIVNDLSFINLMNQLKMGGDTEQSSAIYELADKIDVLTEQVRILNEHLIEQSKQKDGKASEHTESNVAISDICNSKEIDETVHDVRSVFMDGLKKAGKHIKEYGIKGINKCFDFLRIRNGLERVRDLGDRMLAHDATRVELIEKMGEKVHRSAMHFGNAGRELLGNELKTEPSDTGKITSTLKKPIELKTKITKAIMNGAEGAINKLDNLKSVTENAVPGQSQETSTVTNNGETPPQTAGDLEPGGNQSSQEDALRMAQMEQLLSSDMGM